MAPFPTALDNDAARIQLLALRATLPQNATVGSDVVRFTSGEILSAEDAVTYLARQPKPLKCRPGLEESALLVEVVPLSAQEVQTQAIVAAHRDHDLSGRLLVQGRGQTLDVSADGYQRWVRDYVLQDGVVLAGNHPSSEQRSQGITMVWSISRAQTVPEAYRLDDPSAILCERCASRMAILACRPVSGKRAVIFVCDLCYEALRGAEFVRVMNEAAGAEVMPMPTTDEALRRVVTDLLKGMHSDGGAA